MKKTFITAFLAIAMTIGFSTAKAQGPCLGQNIPGLSDDQKTKIEAVHKANMQKALPIMNQIKEKEAHLNTLRTAEKANISEINATIEEIGKLRIEEMKMREASIQDIRKILNDDQRIQFDMHQDNPHHARHNTHQGNHKQHQGHGNCPHQEKNCKAGEQNNSQKK